MQDRVLTTASDRHPSPQGTSPLSPKILVGLTVAAIAVGVGAAWLLPMRGALNGTAPNASTHTPTVDAPAISEQPEDTHATDGAAPPAGDRPLTPDAGASQGNDPTGTVQPEAAIAQVYWLRDTGTGLALVPQTVSNPDTAASATAQITAALEQLLTQPPQTGDLASTIPADTRLLDVAMRDDGIHVNVSREFTSGGGSAAMVGRLGQILYTATTLDPDAPVWITVAGEPLEVLGGEGILVSQPMTRAEFDRDAGLSR